MRTPSPHPALQVHGQEAVCCWQDGGNSRQARVLLLVHVDEHLHDLHALREKPALILSSSDPHALQKRGSRGRTFDAVSAVSRVTTAVVRSTQTGGDHVCVGATATLKKHARLPVPGDRVAVYTSQDGDRTSSPEFGVVCEDDYNVNQDGSGTITGTFLTSYDGTVWDCPIDAANYGPGGWEFVDGASKIAGPAAVQENPLADLPYNHGSVHKLGMSALTAVAFLVNFLAAVELECHPHHPAYGNRSARLGLYAHNGAILSLHDLAHQLTHPRSMCVVCVCVCVCVCQSSCKR
jgi:hypothetical protein